MCPSDMVKIVHFFFLHFFLISQFRFPLFISFGSTLFYVFLSENGRAGGFSTAFLCSLRRETGFDVLDLYTITHPDMTSDEALMDILIHDSCLRIQFT
jgi:hypothetical protein